jgi:hypothetical protein
MATQRITLKNTCESLFELFASTHTQQSPEQPARPQASQATVMPFPLRLLSAPPASQTAVPSAFTARLHLLHSLPGYILFTSYWSAVGLSRNLVHQP